jgi:hypothetical protein
MKLLEIAKYWALFIGGLVVTKILIIVLVNRASNQISQTHLKMVSRVVGLLLIMFAVKSLL